MAKERKVAIFDVDGTIFRSSLLIQVVNALIASEAFPEETRETYEHEYAKWLDREGDYESYIDAVVKAFRAHLKGVHYSALVDAADKVVEEQWKRTYRYTRDLIKQLKEKDYFLLAVSHSPKPYSINSARVLVSTKPTASSTRSARRIFSPATSSTSISFTTKPTS